MKQGIHPDYVESAITCNGCGNTVQTRATSPKIEVEICGECHPFYTGKQKLVDVAGRVDRFRARQQQAGEQTRSKRGKQDRKAGKQDRQKSDDSARKDLSDLKNLQDQ